MWFSDFDWSWSFKSVPQMLPDFRISRHIATLRPLGVEPLSAQLLKNGPYTGHPPFDLYWIWIHRVSLHREHLNISKYWFWLVLAFKSFRSWFWFIFDSFICCSAAEGLHSGKKKTAGSWPQVQRRPFDIVSQHENVPDVDGSKPMTWLNQHPSTSQKNHPGARVLSHTQIWYDLHQFTTKEPQIFVALFIQSFAW